MTPAEWLALQRAAAEAGPMAERAPALARLDEIAALLRQRGLLSTEGEPAADGPTEAASTRVRERVHVEKFDHTGDVPVLTEYLIVDAREGVVYRGATPPPTGAGHQSH